MAADLTQTFMGKHVEKVVLAAAVAIFLGAFVWFVVLRTPQEDLRLEVQGEVERLRRKVGEKVTLEAALKPEERVALRIGRPGLTVEDLRAAIEGPLPEYQVAMRMVPPLPKTRIVEPEKERFYLPERILAAEQVQAVTGYGVTDEEVPTALAVLPTEDATYRDIAWAGVVAKFDLTEQLRLYQEPYIKEGKGRTAPLPRQCPIVITRVEVRRRQVLPDGTTTDWEAVEPSMPAEAAANLPSLPSDPKDKALVGRWFQGLVQNQLLIRRPPFYNLLTVGGGQTVDTAAGTVSGVAQPDLAPYETGRAAAAAATPAPTAAPKPGETAPPTPPAPESTARSPWEAIITTPSRKPAEPTQPTAPAAEHVYATLWAADATVQPGKTYQYQIRVAVLNPVWSLPNVEPPEATWQLELFGDWSEPTPPVTVPELSAFYFVGTFGNRVNLELHRWIHGTWVVVPSAPSLLGAPVLYTKRSHRIPVPGGSGKAVAVDVTIDPDTLPVDVIREFPYYPRGGNRPVETNVLIYSDRQGNLMRRIEWEDRERAREDKAQRLAPAVAPPKKPPAGRTPARRTR